MVSVCKRERFEESMLLCDTWNQEHRGHFWEIVDDLWHFYHQVVNGCIAFYWGVPVSLRCVESGGSRRTRRSAFGFFSHWLGRRAPRYHACVISLLGARSRKSKHKPRRGAILWQTNGKFLGLQRASQVAKKPRST